MKFLVNKKENSSITKKSSVLLAFTKEILKFRAKFHQTKKASFHTSKSIFITTWSALQSNLSQIYKSK